MMRDGQARGRPVMRSWMVSARLHRGPLTHGQREAVKLILGAKDPGGGCAGLCRHRQDRHAEARPDAHGKERLPHGGVRAVGFGGQDPRRRGGIDGETLQLFLAHNAGVAEGGLSKKGKPEMRSRFAKTVLVVDEGSLASTVQARDVLRIATVLRIPREVLVSDSKQLDAVDAGKPFAQLQQTGMKTAIMDEIMRQRDPELKAAVEASLTGEIGKAFEKLGRTSPR